MSAMVSELPATVARRLADFCEAKQTGTLQLDIKDGNVVGWRITESGKVERAR